MFPNDDMSSVRQEISLLELNNRVKGVLLQAFPATYWVRAEMSDVRQNVSSGHCYLEFIEKHPSTGQLLAKVRGYIWAKTFHMLKPYFESETGQAFASGLKVLVKVTVEFHELYGYSLTVVDIDPAYTLGDMVRRRLEIVRQLQEEGVFTLNKELPFPILPQRIAIITSPTAAGYEDFLQQLTNNKAGYMFYPKLFPAVMQGDKTEESVISALDKVYEQVGNFDVVVIIRGGGATSDLHSFDSYLLAANCAQFPLPIITGIGHERDDTVIDMVAHTRAKTPTAVAEFLIGRLDEAAGLLDDLKGKCSKRALEVLNERRASLQLLMATLPALAGGKIERSQMLLQHLGMKLPALANTLLERKRVSLIRMGIALPGLAVQTIDRKRTVLDKSENGLRQVTSELLSLRRHSLQLNEQFIILASPEHIMQRGYSMILKDGCIVKRASDMQSGDLVTIRFADGDKDSRIL